MTAMIAKVARKEVSGLDSEMSNLLNALKASNGEEIAYHALDEEALLRVVTGDEVAGSDIQGVCKVSYEALKIHG